MSTKNQMQFIDFLDALQRCLFTGDRLRKAIAQAYIRNGENRLPGSQHDAPRNAALAQFGKNFIRFRQRTRGYLRVDPSPRQPWPAAP